MNDKIADRLGTKTPPTEPGLYYWKLSEKSDLDTIRVVETIKDIWGDGEVRDYPVLTCADGVEVDSFDGLWGGRVPAPGTTFTVEEIAYYIENLQGKSHASAAQLLFNAVADITHPQDGIAATTERNKKEGV